MTRCERRFVPLRHVRTAILATVMLAAPGSIRPLQANEDGVRVTIDKPATVPVSEAREPAATGIRRLVVTVTGFAPSPAGPVVTVVAVRCGNSIKEIGRFGVFPHAAFTASSTVKPQRFGFDLPDDPDCRRPQDVMIRLEPSIGNGAGASMTIGNASLE